MLLCPNFMSKYCGLMPVWHNSVLNQSGEGPSWGLLCDSSIFVKVCLQLYRECGGCQLCRFRCHTQFASPRCASICEAFCLRWQRRTLSNSELQHSCKLGTCKFPGRPSLAMQIRSQGYMVLRQQPAAGIRMGSPDPHTAQAELANTLAVVL